MNDIKELQPILRNLNDLLQIAEPITIKEYADSVQFAGGRDSEAATATTEARDIILQQAYAVQCEEIIKAATDKRFARSVPTSAEELVRQHTYYTRTLIHLDGSRDLRKRMLDLAMPQINALLDKINAENLAAYEVYRTACSQQRENKYFMNKIEEWKEKYYNIDGREPDHDDFLEMTDEEALRHSIRKWEGARTLNLPLGLKYTDRRIESEEDGYFTFHGESCALCHKYVQIEGNCDNCPLAHTGYECDQEDSPWRKSKNYPEPMIRALKEALYHITGAKENE
jgi:hypothetical protein